MRAAVLHEHVEIEVGEVPRRYPGLPLRSDPLVIEDIPEPSTTLGQVLLRVLACGVCYTDIDIIEGRVRCKLPVIPGHQVVGKVIDVSMSNVQGIDEGDIVGVAWIGKTCGECRYCSLGLENLCQEFAGTGCHLDGGYAEFMAAYGEYVYKLPKNLDYVHAAPLLCAGAVGYRALRLVNPIDGMRLGLFGFGASAHIIIQIARRLFPSSEIYVFSRSSEHRELARKLGADWVGHPQDTPPRKIDRAIDFTPVGEITARALEYLDRGGVLAVNVIRKQTPINLDYTNHLWYEKQVRSVANVTRRDVEELLKIVSTHPVEIHVQLYDLEDANKALRDLKLARIRGSAVLRIS